MNSPQRMAVLGVAMFVVSSGAMPVADLRAGEQGVTVTGNPAPTAEQIQALFARLVENQHRNDLAIEEFDRVEHVITRKGGENSPVLSDLTSRVIPSGTGITRVNMAENGMPVPRELYRHELQIAADALELAVHPNDREKQDFAKFEKRRHDRAELLDSTMKAFRIKWAGHETRGSRTFAKLLLDPDPDFVPATRLEGAFEHMHAVLWVDESQAQMARVEADITSDIAFGGGIIGKVYRGGHFVVEQAEVAPGIWLPTLFLYNMDGRRFLFGFDIHERTEVTQYRRLGPPAEAITIIRDELNELDHTGETPAH